MWRRPSLRVSSRSCCLPKPKSDGIPKDIRSVPFDFTLTERVLAAMLVAYLLGSIPFAQIAGRMKGVDIFTTGSRSAGTANVFWNIGRRMGILVFMGDVSKGSVAIVVAWSLAVTSPLILLVGCAALLGHWKSLFAGFKGGDGMATMIGLIVALIPAVGLFGLAFGTAVVLLRRRSALRSAWGMASSMLVIMALSFYYQIDRQLLMGLIALGMLVLARSVIGHQRRGITNTEDAITLDLDLDLLDLDLDKESDLGPTAPGNQ